MDIDLQSRLRNFAHVQQILSRRGNLALGGQAAGGGHWSTWSGVREPICANHSRVSSSTSLLCHHHLFCRLYLLSTSIHSCSPHSSIQSRAQPTPLDLWSKSIADSLVLDTWYLLSSRAVTRWVSSRALVTVIVEGRLPGSTKLRSPRSLS